MGPSPSRMRSPRGYINSSKMFKFSLIYATYFLGEKMTYQQLPQLPMEKERNSKLFKTNVWNSLGNHVSSWNLGPKHDSLGQMGPSSAMKHAKIFGESCWGHLVESFSPQCGCCKALSSRGNLFEEIAQKLHPFFILLWKK